MSGGRNSVPVIPYADANYWEERYSRETYDFEWFVGYTALRRVIRSYIPKKKLCLHVGCGASNLQEGMAKAGFTVVNTDISVKLIQQLKVKHAHYPNLSYHVSDCRCMPEFKVCQFGSVIDKGTVDALLCCKSASDNIGRMFSEVSRVLQPGGVFLLITLGDPTRRLPLLLRAEYQWQVTLLLLPKLEPTNQAIENGSPINDSLKPLDVDGPYQVLDTNTVVGLPPGLDPSQYFYVYVCKKEPLQLAHQPGQRLPNGWATGSKEIFEKLQQELGLPPDLLKKGKRTRKLSLREVARGGNAEQEQLWQQIAARMPRPQSAPSISSSVAATADSGSSAGSIGPPLPVDAHSLHAAAQAGLVGSGPGSSLAAALASDVGMHARLSPAGLNLAQQGLLPDPRSGGSPYHQQPQQLKQAGQGHVLSGQGSLYSPGTYSAGASTTSPSSFASLAAAMCRVDADGGNQVDGQVLLPPPALQQHYECDTCLPMGQEGSIIGTARRLLAPAALQRQQQQLSPGGTVLGYSTGAEHEAKMLLGPSTPSPALTPGRSPECADSSDGSNCGNCLHYMRSDTPPFPQEAGAGTAAAVPALQAGYGCLPAPACSVGHGQMCLDFKRLSVDPSRAPP